LECIISVAFLTFVNPKEMANTVSFLTIYSSWKERGGGI